jgi:hypothetical protein
MHSSRYFGFHLGLALISTLGHAFNAAVTAVCRTLDLAFPPQAAAERLAPQTVTSSEAVVYGAGKARTRSFLGRLAQRDNERQAFGALGLNPAF